MTPGLDPRQFDRHVIKPTLAGLDPAIPDTDTAYRLVWETIWHESNGLRAIAQYGGGPGLGVAQIEPPTFAWLNEWLDRPQNARFRNAIQHTTGRVWFGFSFLPVDLALSVAFCRLRYWVVPSPLPNPADGVRSRAHYWGKYYQTTNDPVKIAKYVIDAEQLWSALT